MIKIERRNPPRIGSAKAADYLGVTNACLCIWRKQGTGPPYFRFGSRYYYAVKDLDEWIEACAVTPPGAAQQ
ncbi:MAG: helix-turn-helix domain-containing protein [Rhodothermales bacterium]|nr:helix-turn-helix domain-containing protein [Rhodothermales bacterium]